MTPERKKELTQLAHDMADIFQVSRMTIYANQVRAEFPKEPELEVGKIYKVELGGSPVFTWLQYLGNGNFHDVRTGLHVAHVNELKIIGVMEEKPIEGEG